jgi:hypothetical protein
VNIHLFRATFFRWMHDNEGVGDCCLTPSEQICLNFMVLHVAH